MSISPDTNVLPGRHQIEDVRSLIQTRRCKISGSDRVAGMVWEDNENGAADPHLTIDANWTSLTDFHDLANGNHPHHPHGIYG